VPLLATTDLAARGLAGFGKRMTDDQPTEAVKPVGGPLLAQTSLKQDRGDRLHQRERWRGDRGSRAQQGDDVRMGEDGGSRCARDRSKILVPGSGGRGHLDFAEDKLDEAVKQRGLVGEMAVDGHRVDAQLGAEPAHGQLLKAVLVDDPQSGHEDLIARNARWTTTSSGRRFGRHDALIYSVEIMPMTSGVLREAVLR